MAKRSEATAVAEPLTHQEDPILTICEVAKQLNRSPQTITRWCNDGLLIPLRRPDDKIFGIRKSEVNRFLGGSALNKQVV